MMSRVLRWGVLALAVVGMPALAEDGSLAKLELRPGVTLAVTELRRVPDKGLVIARFGLANGSAEAVSLADLGLSDGRRLENLSLIDFKNGREYAIGSGYSGCLCSRIKDDEAVGAGERRDYWAMYGNPPAEVVKLAVMVMGLPPVFDVPLAK